MATKEAKFVEKIDEDFLNCAVCCERYKDSKILPCVHSFCKTCLIKLVGGRPTLTCPVCCRIHRLSDNGIDDFPSNFFVNQLAEEFRRRREVGEEPAEPEKCGGCDKDKAVQRCLECAFVLCVSCVDAHKRIPVTRHHNLLSLAAYEEAKVNDLASVQPPIYCGSHKGSEVKFFCDSCQVPICLECTALDHSKPEHKYRYLKDAAKEHKVVLKEMIEELTGKENDARDSICDNKKMTNDLETRFQAQKQQINECVKETIAKMTGLVEESGKRLMGELTDEYNSRKRNLKTQLKDLDLKEGDLTNAREYTEKIMHYGNDAQLMSVINVMIFQFKELLQIDTKCPPAADSFLEFHPSEDFCQDKEVGLILKEVYETVLTSRNPGSSQPEELSFSLVSEDPNSSEKDETEVVDRASKAPGKTVVEVVDKEDETLSLRCAGEAAEDYEITVSVPTKGRLQGSCVRVKLVPRKGLVDQIGERGKESGRLNGPFGITANNKKGLLICDHGNERLQEFKMSCQVQKGDKIVKCIYLDDRKYGGIFKPCFSTVSEKDEIFVTSDKADQVFVCDENGKLIRCFGGETLVKPRGIAISPLDGRVYIVNMGGHSVAVFKQDGEHLFSFGEEGKEIGQFSYPWCVAIKPDGSVVISDCGNHRIQVFSGDGQYLYSFGAEGSDNGQLDSPEGLALDKAGNMYVCDHYNNRVLKYNSSGVFVCRVDQDEDGLRHPCDVSVMEDEQFTKLLVTDCGNDCVKAFNM